MEYLCVAKLFEGFSQHQQSKYLIKALFVLIRVQDTVYHVNILLPELVYEERKKTKLVVQVQVPTTRKH